MMRGALPLGGVTSDDRKAMPMSPNRTAVVTGALGGIGRVTVASYLRAGYDVVAMDVAEDALASLGSDLAQEHPDRRIETFTLDVGDPDSVERAARAVDESFGRVDALALVAGVVQDAYPVASMPIEEWDRVHAVNLRGPFLMARAFIPLMPKHDAASIVAIASWWGRSGHPFYAAYCSSKAGVISLVQCLASELAADGIRVNGVAPGNIDTRMHRAALETEAAERGITFEEMKDIEWAKIPLGVAGPPQSIADAVLFLSSERADYITGATLDVNGGVIFS